tara:strand:+ start:1287 stop:1472 length:186 start_codon:yes stop_codon:yes gene_type:complete
MTLQLTTPTANALRDAVEKQLNNWERFAAMLIAEGKPEPENARQVRIELARVVKELEKGRN